MTHPLNKPHVAFSFEDQLGTPMDPSVFVPSQNLKQNVIRSGSRLPCVFLSSAPPSISRGKRVVLKTIDKYKAQHEAFALHSLRNEPFIGDVLGWFEGGYILSTMEKDVAGMSTHLPCLPEGEDALSHTGNSFLDHVRFTSDPRWTTLVLTCFSRGDLFSYQRTRKSHHFREPVVRRMAHQMLQAMVSCHQMGIIHGDLKLENVFVTRRGDLRLGDFDRWIPVALARGEKWPSNMNPAEDSYHHYPFCEKNTRWVVGTLEFMSPETLIQNRVEPASDVWTLAHLIHELITGSIIKKLIPSGKRSLQNMKSHIINLHLRSQKGISVDPEVCHPHMSSALQHFLEQCFMFDPEQRPSVNDLLSHPWIHGYESINKISWTSHTKTKTIHSATQLFKEEEKKEKEEEKEKKKEEGHIYSEYCFSSGSDGESTYFEGEIEYEEDEDICLDYDPCGI